MSTFTFNTSTWQALPQRSVVWEGVRGDSVGLLLSGRGRGRCYNSLTHDVMVLVSFKDH